MTYRIHHRGRLVAAVDHAIGTFFIIAGAVSVPVSLLHQLFEGLGVAFAEQIARALPAKEIACRIAPGGAAVGLVAGEKIEEQARLVERPATAAAREDAAEQFLGASPIQKMLLI